MRKVDPSGAITTVVGGGDGGAVLENQPAVKSYFYSGGTVSIKNIAVGPDSTLYILYGDTNVERLYTVGIDGILRRLIPSTQSLQAFAGDGSFLRAGYEQALAVDRRGILYFVARINHGSYPYAVANYLCSMSPYGKVHCFAGGARRTITTLDGTVVVPRNVGDQTAGLTRFVNLETAPDGSMVVWGDERRLYSFGAETVGLCGVDTQFVPDGEKGYCFDLSGTHLKTVDLHTGATVLTFGYVDGSLSSITDAAGQNTSVEQNDNTITITAPHGQTTVLQKNALFVESRVAVS